MASDSQDSHRKHHRTPSEDDSPDNSKRHKHRHHRHHRRRHHHHRSKKNTVDGVEEVVVMEERENVTTKPPRLVSDYDDMEEGEIVDDDDMQEEKENVPEVEVSATTKACSDVESGEFKAGDDSYMSVDNDRNGVKHLKSPVSDQSGESKEDGSHVSERISNGDLVSRSRKGESRLHTGHKSLSKESSKEKDHHWSKSKQQVVELMEEDIVGNGNRRNSYSSKVKEVSQKATHRSPSHGRYNLETTGDRSRSKSPDRTRERERSQSILHETLKLQHHHERDDRLYNNGKVCYELDDERDSRVGTDYRAGGGEKAMDKGRERGSTYHRSSVCEGKHEGGDSWDRETEEKLYREKKRVEREPSKERSERDHDRDWEKERYRIRSRDLEKEKELVRDRERTRGSRSDMDWDRDRGGSRERDLDRERERERRRNKDRDRSRDWDHERERRRGDSISMNRDRDTDKELDRARERSRKLEIDRERERYSGRDRHRDKARDDESDRSRRYHKYDDRDDDYGNRDRRRGYDEAEYCKDRKMKHELDEDQISKDESLKENKDEINGDGDDQKDYQEMVDSNPADHEEDDVDRIKEESRRRREAILQKYKVQPLQQQQAVPQFHKVSNEELADRPSQRLPSAKADQENNNGVKGNVKDVSVAETSSNSVKSSLGNDSTAVERSIGALGEGSPKSERSNDMFCDDIFGDSPAGVRKTGKGDGLPLERSGLHDNWDDPDGYYSFRFGEILDSRYEITAAHGKGVFSTVVRAKDLKAGSSDPEEVAIKIIRNNETMLKAGTEELVILKKLVGADPDDRRHCVRYLSHFKYRNHLCIVFESLHMNLREVLKKFGRNIGLKLTAVRTYAKQLFIALKHLRNCGVLHCDIKPDNMLVNDSKNVLKLCDFGNAMFAGKNEITPYLVSRFYRAPEIILGLSYDHPMDIWSVGCCLYELYTGKVLFPGATNNDMLRLHMELKGPFPKKMLRKGAFIEQHFDQDLNFLATEEDPVTKKSIRRLMVNIKPKDIGNIIRGSPGEDTKMLANFKDLLDKIFVLDPDKRLTVSQALNHPFITGK